MGEKIKKFTFVDGGAVRGWVWVGLIVAQYLLIVTAAAFSDAVAARVSQLMPLLITVVPIAMGTFAYTKTRKANMCGPGGGYQPPPHYPTNPISAVVGAVAGLVDNTKKEIFPGDEK